MDNSDSSTMSGEDLVFYVPIHSNFSQVEHTAAFISSHNSKLFLYTWNTEKSKMQQFYSQFWKQEEQKKGREFQLDIFDFSFDNILSNLHKEREAKKKVVILLTASTNYPFGIAQNYLFMHLKTKYPDVIVDVFPVGHCLYGCQSCGVREHQIPVYFTRFFKRDLPYSTADVKGILEKQKRGKTKGTVLLCPSVGPYSYLSDRYIINALIAAQKNLQLVFMVKLHGFCHLDKNHPLSGISDIERANVQLLRENFITIDESQYNILPLIDAFDTLQIISDVDSSVSFEALYFYPKQVIAYHRAQQELPEGEYLEHLHLFSTDTQLTDLLLQLQNATLPQKQDGRQFFRKKYGEVNGDEVQRIAHIRKWNANVNVATEPTTLTPQQLQQELTNAIDNGKYRPSELITAVDYLGMGIEIPQNILQFERFLSRHTAQLEALGVPRSLWMQVYEKVSKEVFDIGEVAQLQYDDGYQLILTQDIPKESRVFLIDHAWTTDFQNARQQLKDNPQLVERLYSMFDLDQPNDDDEEEEGAPEDGETTTDAAHNASASESTDKDESKDKASSSESKSSDATDTSSEAEDKVSAVWNKMWKYNQTYKILTASAAEQSVWYVMDEVGSAIAHSDSPNFKCMPFLCLDTATAYSLLWPIQDVHKDDLVTRDFYPNDKDNQLQRAAHMLVWNEDIALEQFEEARKAYLSQFPSTSQFKESTAAPVKITKKQFTVYSDIDLVNQNLKHSAFKLVSSMEEADILWLTTEYKHFAYLKAHQLCNQFPNESALTFKHLLPETLLKCHGSSALEYLPITYNMDTQLAAFIGEFTHRQKEGLDNSWIIKPWNLGRSLDLSISNNRDTLIRLSETGQKVAMKCNNNLLLSIHSHAPDISNPLLYEGRKFDLRYCVLLKSVEPLEVYVYNFFWIRLANEQFAMDDFEKYEKHFTVMNYTTHNMTQLKCPDFIKGIEAQYPSIKWETVQKRINDMFRKTFEAAAAADPPVGFGKTHQSRAMYGIDIMLDQNFQPKLLEVNFSPDTTRACWDPTFYDKVFSVLFLNPEDAAPNSWEAVTKL